MHLVTLPDHARFLRLRGHVRARAVGMPFIYADVSGIPRIQGSVLAMPPHSLPYTRHRWLEREYVDFVQGLRDHFAYVAVCVHSSCMAHGLWAREFRSAGVPVFEGAMTEDANSLLRMQILMRSFHAITTNTIGSHVLYAAYTGARVSIAGPYAEYTEADYANDPRYQRHPEQLAFNIEHSSERRVKARFPQFFVEPHRSETHVAWASVEAGASYRKSPADMKRFLGWSPPARALRRVLRAARAASRVRGSKG
jgi:hypothetical protein